MHRAIHGVNLGGWLVLERWMTPSLFQGMAVLDEMRFCESADDAARRRLREHRNTFITEADFHWLAERGINAVRIPIGYWTYGDVHPFEGTIDYLDKAFRWAETAGIRVLISLHGAPGSQNGKDHSGCTGPVAWHADQRNIDASLDIVRRLARRYQDSSALMGLSVLNEPDVGLPKPLLKQYYRESYRIIRQECGYDTWVVFSDGFAPERWDWVLHRLFYENVYIDTHQYQVFSQADKELDVPGHLRKTVTTVRRELQRMRRHHPVIVGEWSAVLDPVSLRGLDEAGKQEAYREYCQAQQREYERTSGWFYWNYKTEAGDAWSFRDCYDKGWFLQ